MTAGSIVPVAVFALAPVPAVVPVLGLVRLLFERQPLAAAAAAVVVVVWQSY